MILQVSLFSAFPLDSVNGIYSDYRQLSSAHALSKRAVPSTDDIVKAIDKNGQVGKKPSVFWTAFYDQPSPSPYFTAVNWAKAKFGGQRCNFVMYTDLLADDDYQQLQTMTKGPDESDLAIKHFSKAFARRSVGTAYLVVPDGREPSATSTWTVWEAPTLTRSTTNGQVDKIIKAEVPSGRETAIWVKGSPALYAPAPPGRK